MQIMKFIKEITKWTRKNDSNENLMVLLISGSIHEVVLAAFHRKQISLKMAVRMLICKQHLTHIHHHMYTHTCTSFLCFAFLTHWVFGYSRALSISLDRLTARTKKKNWRQTQQIQCLNDNCIVGCTAIERERAHCKNRYKGNVNWRVLLLLLFPKIQPNLRVTPLRSALGELNVCCVWWFFCSYIDSRSCVALPFIYVYARFVYGSQSPNVWAISSKYADFKLTFYRPTSIS